VEAQKQFNNESAAAVLDTERRSIFESNINRYEQSFSEGVLQFSNFELARKRAGSIRHNAIQGLEKYLIDFEANFEKHGGKVIWAQDDTEAVVRIVEILKKRGVLHVVKSKSLLTDEIGLPEVLENEGIEYTETNPGEFILRKSCEKSCHLSSPSIHKSVKDIAGTLKQNTLTATALNIQEFVRKELRIKIETAEASIIGANYLIADTGSVCISEDEGDAALGSAIPKLQIVIAGIDKIIPSLINLDLFLPLFATADTGECINAYNTILSGPRQDGETDGPVEMFVVLLDNKRSEVIAQKFQRSALSCIDCGACQNTCPVYSAIGGTAYATTYTGPVGSIVTPWMKGFEEYIHLSYACALCGRCTQVCPVHINLHELILYNRNDAVRLKTYSLVESLTMGLWHQALKNRKWMDWSKIQWKNLAINKIYADKWGEDSKFPEVCRKNFKQLWEERREGKN